MAEGQEPGGIHLQGDRARASSAELLTQALITRDIGYIAEDRLAHIEKETNHISTMLYRLIRVRSSTQNKPPSNP